MPTRYQTHDGLSQVGQRLAEADEQAKAAVRALGPSEPFDAESFVEAVRSRINGKPAVSAESFLDAVWAGVQEDRAPSAESFLDAVWRGIEPPVEPERPEPVPVPAHIAAFFPKPQITPEAVDAERLLAEVAATAPVERPPRVLPKRMQMPLERDEAGVAGIQAQRDALEGAVAEGEEADRARRWIEARNRAALQATDWGLPGAAGLARLPEVPIEPLTEAEPGYWEYILHGTRERVLLPWRGLKSVQAMGAVDRILDAEIKHRVAHGLHTPEDQVRAREWTEWARTLRPQWQQAMRADGTWQAHAGSTFLDTAKLRENVNAELLNGLPMYAPENAEAQEGLYKLMAEASPAELPAAKGFWKKLAAFGGDIVPFFAEIAILRKATGPVGKTVGKATRGVVARERIGEEISTRSGIPFRRKVRGMEPRRLPPTREELARLPKPQREAVIRDYVDHVRQRARIEAGVGGAVSTGLAFGAEAALRGEDPVDALITGTALPIAGTIGGEAAQAVGARAGIGAGVGTGALFAGETAIAGGDLADVLIAGVVTPLVFHTKDIIRYPFRPRAMVVWQGRGIEPPRSVEDLGAEWGTSGKLIQRFVRIAQEIGKDPLRNRVDHLRSYNTEIEATVRALEKLYERRAELRAHERMLLEGFFGHYDAKVVRQRTPGVGTVAEAPGVPAEKGGIPPEKPGEMRIPPEKPAEPREKLRITAGLEGARGEEAPRPTQVTEPTIPGYEELRSTSGERIAAPGRAKPDDLQAMRTEALRIVRLLRTKDFTRESWDRLDRRRRELKRLIAEEWERQGGIPTTAAGQPVHPKPRPPRPLSELAMEAQRPVEPKREDQPAAPRPIRRIGLKEAEEVVLEIHERHREAITGEEAELYVPEEEAEPLRRGGYAFPDTPEGRSAARELRERLPAELQAQVRVLGRDAPEVADGADVMAEIGTEAMAEAIRYYAGQSRAGILEATAAFVEGNPEMFWPEERYAVERYRAVAEAPETAAEARRVRPQVVAAEDLRRGDTMRIVGQGYRVIEIDPETGTVYLQGDNGYRREIGPDDSIGIDAGTLRNRAGEAVRRELGIISPPEGEQPTVEGPAPGIIGPERATPRQKYAAILNDLPGLRMALTEAERQVGDAQRRHDLGAVKTWIERRDWLRDRIADFGGRVRALKEELIKPPGAAEAAIIGEEVPEGVRPTEPITEAGREAPGVPTEPAEAELEPGAAPARPTRPAELGAEGGELLEREPPERLPADVAGREPGEVPPGRGRAVGRPRGEGPGDYERGRGVQPGVRPVPTTRGRDADAGYGEARPGGRPGPAERRPAERTGREPAEPAEPQRIDHIIQPGDVVFPAGAKTRVRANLEAIRLLKQLQAEGRPASADEQAILVRYTGWGPNRELWKGSGWSPDPEWKPLYDEVSSLLSAEEMQEARRAQLNAMYTSPEIVGAIYEALERIGFQGGYVVEPALGTGHFFGAMPDTLRGATKRVGVELEPISAAIAQLLYPSAKIYVEGYERAALPDNFFDLAVSNIPFGAIEIADLRYPPWATRKIHDYFFVKTLDTVRPGGLIAFLTSQGTMNKLDSRTRDYIAERADLLGAIRLNEESLPGTRVIGDILFLRRRLPGEKAAGEPWAQSREINVPDRTGETTKRFINEYFVAHPEMVLGRIQAGSQYGPGTGPTDVTVLATEGALSPSEAVERLPADAVTVQAGAEQLVGPKDPIDLVPAPKDVPPAAYALIEGKLHQVDAQRRAMPLNEAAILAKKGGKQRLIRLRDLIGLRDTALELQRAMLGDRPEHEIARLQKNLNVRYDRLVAKHKTFIHGPKTTLRAAVQQDQFTISVLKGLERWNPETKRATKTEIFSKRILERARRAERADSASDALLIALNETGRLDLDRMAELLGSDPDQVRDELLAGGQIFAEPSGGCVVRDEYLSGDVRAKLEQAERANEIEPGKFTPNIDELKTVIPKDLEPGQIAVSLGAAWVPPDVYTAFAKHLFGERWDIKLSYVPATARWTVSAEYGARESAAARDTWGTAALDGVRLLKKTLNHQVPVVMMTEGYTDSEGKQRQRRVRDEEQTALAQERQEAIQKEFDQWIWSDGRRVAQLVPIYNRQFNGIVPRQFSGEHLSFPGMSPVYRGQMRGYQRRGVHRAISQPTTLLYWHVGSGKTWSAIAAAMEWARLRISPKNLIVAHRATYDQFVDTAQAMYPAGRILALRTEDLQGARRREMLSQIAFGDWSVVIMPQETFRLIPMRAETQRAFFQRRIAELEDALYELRQDRQANRNQIREVETIKANYEARLRQRLAALEKDPSGMRFEDLGFTGLVYDESQALKNLAYTTQMQGVKGLGTPTGSDRAFDALMKTEHIRSLDGKLMFMSGTPVANSVVELFTVMRYLCAERLRERGIHHLDNWIAAFGDIAEDIEKAVELAYKPATRLRRFKNLPELMRLFREFTDVVKLQELIEDYGLLIPGIAENSQGQHDYEVVLVPETKQSRRLMQEIQSLAEYIKQNFREARKQGLSFFTVTNRMRKGALDPRLVSKEYGEDDRDKLNQAADNVHRLWERYRAGSDQLPDVFKPGDIDIGKGLTQIVFIQQGVNPTRWGFALYEEFIQKLVDRGIPREEIARIHDWEKKEGELFRRVNAGQIRVVIGSGAKMGIGVNVHRLLGAMHMLDPTWRPDEIRQMEGRIRRSGNLNETVHLIRYAGKGTGDEVLFNRVYMKQLAIDQLLQGDLNVREMEEIDPETLSYAEIQGIASNNPVVLKWHRQNQAVLKLRHLQGAFTTQQANLRVEEAALREETSQLSRNEPLLRGLVEWLGKQPSEFAITVQDRSYDKRKEAGAAILGTLRDILPDPASVTKGERPNWRKVGSYRRVELSATVRRLGDEAAYYLRLEVPTEYAALARPGGTLAGPELWVEFHPKADAVGLIRRIENKAQGWARSLQWLEDRLGVIRPRAAELAERIVDRWPRAEELREAEKKFDQLTDELQALDKAKPASVEEPGLAIGGQLTPDQEKWLRKLGPDQPGFGLGAMRDIPDPRNHWQRCYDAVRHKLLYPESELGKKVAKFFGRALYGPGWQMSEADYNRFELISGTQRLARVQAADIAKDIDKKAREVQQRIEARADRLDEKLRGAGAELVNERLTRVFDGEASPETLDPDLRAIYDVTMERVNEITDYYEARPWLHPFAVEIGGLRNFNEIVLERRAGNKGWLRRVFKPEKPTGPRQFEKYQRDYFRKRIKAGVFMPRESDIAGQLALWTVRHRDGTSTQYPDPDLAQDAWMQERDELLRRFGVDPEKYRKGEIELAPGVAEQLNRVQLRDPFGKEQIREREIIPDIRIRIARTLEDWAVNVQILEVYYQFAELYGRVEEPSPEEGLPEYARIPDHKIFGPLAGLWVPEPVWYNVIAFEQFKTGFLPELWRGFNYVWKSAHVVWSPRTWMNNLWGLHFSYVLDGLHPTLHAKWFVEAHRQFRNRGADWERLVRQNVINVGWTHEMWDAYSRSSEWIRAMEEFSRDLSGPAGTITNAGLRFYEGIRTLNRKLGYTYDYPDQVSKLASYLKHRYQDGMSHEAALHEVDGWYPNYARPGQYARWARKSPFGCTFVMFNEQYAKIGLRAARDRPARLLLMWMLPKMMEWASRIILGVTAAELAVIDLDRRRRRRSGFEGPAAWLADEINYWFQPLMPWKSKDGKLQYFDLRWKFPLADEFRVDTGPGGIGLPFILNTPIVEAIKGLAGRDPYTGNLLWKTDSSADTKLLRYLGYVAKEMTPAPTLVTRGIPRILDAGRKNENTFGRVILHEVFGAAPKTPWVRRADMFKDAKRLLKEKEYDLFRETLEVYNNVYRSEWSKPIRPRVVADTVQRDEREARRRELLEARR